MTAARQGGFTYLGVLFLVSLLGLTASMASAVWSTAQQRENERQLVFAGQQIQAAIERYRREATGTDARFPRELNDLLRDPRVVGVRRQLRQVYVDPMTGRREWGLIRMGDGSVVGVHSLSARKPFGGPPPSVSAQSTTGDYRDWKFIAPSAIDLIAPSPAASGVPRGAASAPA